MPQTQDTVLLREAVAAAKAGNKAQARQLLRQASVHNPNNELVWLWRASLSESPKEATFYLGEVLRVNPTNQKAVAWLERCKGGVNSPEGAKVATPPPPSTPIAASPAVQTPPAAADGGFRNAVAPSRPAEPAASPEPLRSEPATPPAAPASPFALPPLRTPVPTANAPRSPIPPAPASPAGPAAPLKGTEFPFAGPRPASPAGPSLQAPVQPTPARWVCPFCSYGSDTSHRRCPTCKAITILEELREVEKNEGVVEKSVREALGRLESIPNDQRQFEHNLYLALGHLNLREATKALPYLKQATAQRRNDWALLGVLDQIQWRKVILVVDDSLTIRKALANFLEKNEFRVVMAEDGRKALERLNEVVPDLVLLDITMPNLDGYQVCKTMKDNALTKAVPVVMLSGKDGIFDKVRGKLAGCSDYVTKPFDPEALLKTIRKYVKA